MGSMAVGIAVITAVMGCSSSEDETLRRVGFKRDKRFLVSGSEEECLEIRRSKGLRKKSSGNNQCGTAVWDEDKEKTSSEDETPKRGRFRKAKSPSKKNSTVGEKDIRQKRPTTEDIDNLES